MRVSPSFILYLAGLSMLGYLATDMYLPAFSAMQSDLQTSSGAIGSSLTIFLAGFAIAQLIWGPLSDRFGRKIVLLIGLGLFAIGCLGMLWVSNTQSLLLFRFIQAVGVCAAAVSWQALVVDRYRDGTANRIFASIIPLVALSPALAPLLGAWLLNYFNWRSIFIVLLLITLLLLIATSQLKERKRAPIQKTQSNKFGFFQLIKSNIFLGNVLMYSACSAAFFAWLTGSPFILGVMGYDPEDIGLSYLPQTLAFLIGGYGCRSMLSRIDSRVLLPWLICGYVLSVIALFLVVFFTSATLITLMIPFCFMALSNGASYPIIVAGALTPFRNNTGQAAALQNTLQLGFCFLSSLLVSTFIAQPLTATTIIMFCSVPIVLLGYWLQNRQYNLTTLHE